MMNARMNAMVRVKPASYADSLREAVDERLVSVLAGVEPTPLRDVLEHAVEGGKRIRPLIAMFACAAAGGTDLDALDAGIAIELLHSSSLIHDDIMDGSSLRRGRPTLHVLHGVPTAILAGDTLIALSFRLLHRITSPRKDRIFHAFSEAFVALCEGQSEDLHFSGRIPVAEASHRDMVEKKTAKLLESSAAIGALIGSGEEYPVRCLTCFGLQLGMAFQAMDDLLDVVGEEHVVGKPVGTDMKNGRQTFLTVVHPNCDRLAHISSLVNEYTESARSAIASLPESSARECLALLAHTLVNRKS